MPADIARTFDEMTLREFRFMPDWHPIGQWFAKADAETKAWREECDRLHAETGLTAAENAEYERMCEVDDVLRQIMDTRARTVDGLRLKVRVTQAAGLADCIGITDEELLPSLIADIEAMTGGQEAQS